MRFAHISDLHLGKRLNRFSLIEDQQYILDEIIKTAEENGCGAMLIAGDIYDKSMPSAEAVKLFDDFITKLSKTDMKTFIISGNHDSTERVAYASSIMEASNIFIAPQYEGELKKVKVDDEYGEVNVFMLPFVKPPHVRTCYPEAEINDYTDMMRTVLENSELDTSQRNVLMCHQFITGAKTCDSEYVTVGTLDNINASVFEGIDYVALGHIHGAQDIAQNVRYCGTPLKYSISESGHKKSVTIVDIKQKGEVTVTQAPLTALRDLRELKGTYAQLMERSSYEGTNTQDFIHITLTDNEDIPEVVYKLRTVYPNLIQLDYDNLRTRKLSQVNAITHTDTKTPIELFGTLFEEQNGEPLSQEQTEYLNAIIESIWEEKA